MAGAPTFSSNSGNIGVWVGPGIVQLMRMPRLPRSLHAYWVHALATFFEQVDAHLAPAGRLLVFFGSTGDVDYLHHLIDAAGLSREELRSLSGYRTYRLRRRSVLTTPP